MSVKVFRVLSIAFVLAAPAVRGQEPSSQESPEARLRRMAEMVNRPVVYQVPGMDQVRVQKDLVYKDTQDDNVRMDVYTPPIWRLASGAGRSSSSTAERPPPRN